MVKVVYRGGLTAKVSKYNLKFKWGEPVDLDKDIAEDLVLNFADFHYDEGQSKPKTKEEQLDAFRKKKPLTEKEEAEFKDKFDNFAKKYYKIDLDRRKSYDNMLKEFEVKLGGN